MEIHVPAGCLRHVVLFKFKPETTQAQIEEIEDGFRAMCERIDAVHGFEWGRDVSVENRNKGFSHCFIVTFADEAGRDAYLPHPEHRAFVEVLKLVVEDILVIDYLAST
ncbi:MAG: Dabb family protein [Candidatus Hydrogenedentota bacterium]